MADAKKRADTPPYGTIRRMLWERRDFARLPFEAKALYVYLCCCPQGPGFLGVFRFHFSDVEEHLGLARDRAEPALEALESWGFVQRFGSWLWIIDALACSVSLAPTNANHRLAVENAVLQVPNDVAMAIRRLYTKWFDPIPDPIPNAMGDRMGDGNGDRPPDAMGDPGSVAVAGAGAGADGRTQGRKEEPPELSESDTQLGSHDEEEAPGVLPMPDVRRAGSRR